MKGFKVDKEWMERNVLSNPTVQSALNAKARRIAPIVKRIALKEVLKKVSGTDIEKLLKEYNVI